MQWEMQGKPFTCAKLEPGDIQEVLIEYDGPRLFVAQTELCLALFFMVDENDKAMRFIVVPTNQKIIDQLKKGLLTVYEALEQPLLWVMETDLDLKAKEVRATRLQDIPEAVLPTQGLMLWPHLQPVFSLRAIGEGLAPGKVPASVIRQVVEGASTALRKAAIHFLNKNNQQEARKTLKSFYDLPAQHFAYNSFEVAFRLPESAQQTLLAEDIQEIHEIGTALQTAIELMQLNSNDSENLQKLDILLLEALEKISPPLSGIVTEFEVGGTLLNKENKKFVFNRESSRQIRTTLQAKRQEQEKITQIEGLVSKLDKDNLTCTLRETSDGKDHACSFSIETLDEVLEAFYHGARVTISGRETKSTGHIEISIFDVAVDDAETKAAGINTSIKS